MPPTNAIAEIYDVKATPAGLAADSRIDISEEYLGVGNPVNRMCACTRDPGDGYAQYSLIVAFTGLAGLASADAQADAASAAQNVPWNEGPMIPDARARSEESQRSALFLG